MTTELTGIGSAQAGNPDGGNGGAPEGSSAPTATTDNAGPAQQPGNLDWVKAKGWANEDGSVKTDELLKGYQALEKQMGSIKRVPDDKATPEQWAAFRKELGWPGEAKGYEFNLPKDLDPDLPYDADLAGYFKEVANDAQLSREQAAKIHDGWVKRMNADTAAYKADLAQRAEAAHRTLVSEWGQPGSEDYIKHRDAAVRAVRQDPKLTGLEDDLKRAGLLTKDNNFTSASIAHLLAGHGLRMQNDSFVGNGAGGAGANPFAKGDPAYNISTQAEIIRTDPARARALATAAGWHRDAIAAIGQG